MTLVARRGRSALALTLILLAVMACGSTSLAAVDQNPMVVLIDVEGNSGVPAEEILAAATHTRIGAPLNFEAIKADQQAIYDLGYFSELGDPEFREAIGGVKVVFHVVEYPALKGYKIEGLTKMSSAEALSYFTLRPGEIINRNTVVKDLRALLEKASETKGVFLKTDSMRIDEDGTVEIKLIEMRLRHLSFVGLHKTKPEVVRREISAKEGEIFDVKEFRQDLQNLFMLGYFEDISPRIVETDQPDLLDVQVEFKEASTGQVSLTASFSTKDGALSGLAKLGDKNLFGTGNSGEISVEANLNKLNFDLSFTDPWLDAKHTSLTLHFYKDFQSDVAAEDAGGFCLANESAKGGEITLGRPLTKNSTLSMTARHQNLLREKADEWPADKDVPGNALPLTGGWVSTNSLSLQYEFKDLKPQESKYVYVASGWKLKLSTEFAGGLLGGDTEYQRFMAEGAKFWHLYDGGVLAVRLMGGYVNVQGGEDKLGTADFNIGGAETLRGYDYRAFNTPGMLLLNTEYRHRFSDNVEGVAFLDMGRFADGDTGVGYGVGMRVYIPYMGQLRFDYGWSRDDPDGRLHFSIGEVF